MKDVIDWCVQFAFPGLYTYNVAYKLSIQLFQRITIIYVRACNTKRFPAEMTLLHSFVNNDANTKASL